MQHTFETLRTKAASLSEEELAQVLPRLAPEIEDYLLEE